MTRKELFLAKMENSVPWVRLVALIEPHYPKAEKGRRPYPLESMLRVYCLQQCYNLRDAATEYSLYEIASMRRFSHLSLDKFIPDHTIIMKFRQLLGKHYLGRQIFDAVNHFLEESGLLMKEGSSIDATILEAPPSNKYRLNQRDPEMHQTKKGNQWHFEMKAYIGVDVRTGLIHTFTTTAAIEHDLNQAHNLLHCEEKYVLAGSGYCGAQKREGLEDTDSDWYIAEQPSKVRKLKEHHRINKVAIKTGYLKASVCAFAEHPFRIIKYQFGFKKTHYRGLAKNDNKLAVLFALSNIYRLSQLIKR